MSNQKIKLTLAMATALLAGHASAQESVSSSAEGAAVAQNLPDGFEILEKHVEAIGGEKAWKKHTGVRMEGTFDMPAFGMGGTVLINMQAPNKRAMVINVEGMGVIKQGTNGEVAWNTQMPGTPPTILEGEDAKDEIKEADFYGDIYPRKKYASAETVGEFTLDDKKVYKVKLVTADGDHLESMFDIETGLLLRQSFKASEDAASFSTETVFKSYKDLGDGIMMASELEIVTPQFSQTITMDSIELDPEFESTTFDPPGAL
ncbi:MAG: hypothetical protein Phyf2KO_23500 [Phycisphaerales bacterium]